MKAPAVQTVSLADRIAALTPRERAFLLAGAVVLALFLLWLLFRPSSAETDAVELADAPPPPAVVAPAPFAPNPVAPPLPVTAAPAAPVGSTQGLTLQGVSGGGPGGGAAILGFGGVQRTVRVGRSVAPGITLKEVGLRHVILSTSGGDMRLEFNNSARPEPATASASGSPSAGQAELSGSQLHQREAMEMRLGLEPHRSGGRIRGYRIKQGPQAAILEKALLKPGDVLLSIGDVPLTGEDQLLKVPAKIGKVPVTVTFERDGLNMTTSVSRLM